MTALRATILGLIVSTPLFAGDPLSGRWILDAARSHYGVGAEPRARETFDCRNQKGRIRCSIQSVRAGGRVLTGTFTAAYDGKRYPSSGIPGVDEVSLSKLDEFVGDATFTNKGAPVFGYRAIKSDDGRSLTIVSVDAVTRRILTSAIVYNAQ